MQSIARWAVVACLCLSYAQCEAATEETSTIELPTVNAVELTFQSRDPQRVPIEDKTLLQHLMRTAASTTRYPIRETRPEMGTGWMDVTGTQVSLDSSLKAVVLRYGAQSRYVKDGTLTGSTLQINIGYQLDRTADTTRIKLTFPSEASLNYKRLLLPARRLWSTEEIVDDYRRVASALATARPHLITVLQGEIESPYKPEAIAGNFERLWGRPPSSSAMQARPGERAIGRETIYVLALDGVRQRVAVSIFPYRDGTKVSYQADVPFTLAPDGSIQGGEGLAALRTAIKRAVED